MIYLFFTPGNRTVAAEPGITLIEAAARAGLIINTPCGGATTCGKCRVRFVDHPPAPTPADFNHLSDGDIRSGWRLACSCRLFHDAALEIPETTRLGKKHQIQMESSIDRKQTSNSAVRKIYLIVSPPALEDNTADLVRIEAALKQHNILEDHVSLETSPKVLCNLSKTLRQANFTGTYCVYSNRLIHFERENTSEAMYGAAFDIGTTTLVGSLLHLGSGEEKAIVSAINPQTAYGDDVLSRIAFASQNRESLRELQQCLVRQLRLLVQEMCGSASISPYHIYDVVFTGNTTMQHILLGLSPAALGMVPFVPTFGHGLQYHADVLELGVNPEAELRIFPVIGAFVGGDTVAGILAADLCSTEDPALMLDIGTNGEIVLFHEGKLFAASTAAGPAFEGSRISCGMRATHGAVEKVTIGEDVTLGVIGGEDPSGICGSGLIDLCGQLRKVGLLQANGKIMSADEVSMAISTSLKNRLRNTSKGEPSFVFYESPDSTLMVTQQDIRQVQLGSGAIRTGITILLKQVGLKPIDLKRVFIAGGFGSFIRRDNAQRIGLIPPEIPHEHIHFVGNTALLGAQLALFSKEAWEDAERIAQKTHHVELSLDPDFALEFAMAMHFPEL